MRTCRILVAFVIILLVGVGTYLYTGSYPIGADVPHSGAVFALLSAVRDRGIEAQSRNIHPPADLSTPRRLSVGAGQYAAMCSGCHLAPGYRSGETWEGLYPQPPQLARGTHLTPGQIFWVVKHGLKFSGMPAWGKSHSDDEIWSITAFVLSVPHLTAQQYKDIVARAPSDADMVKMPMPQARGAGDGSPDGQASQTVPRPSTRGQKPP
ncbi:MAG: c-type cytochrome [Steroidobacteraceae bacterium]